MASAGTLLCPWKRTCRTVLESGPLCDLGGQLHFWKMVHELSQSYVNPSLLDVLL